MKDTVRRSLWAAILFVLAIAPAAVADEITMTNGDRLTGRVVEAKDGSLLFDPPYAPAVSLRMDRIAAIATDEEVTLRMVDKEVLRGRLVTVEGELRLLASEARDETVIVWERVRSINVPDAVWSGTVFAGGVHQAGNTERLSLNVGADAVRRTLDDRLSFSFLYNYAEEDGDLITRDVYGAMKYDYFVTERLYVLLSVEMLKDRFRDLNLRTVVGPGLGRQLWGEDGRTLALEAGVTWFSENRIVEEDEQWITARLGLVFRYRFTPWLRFSDTLTLYPSLEDGGDYTLRNDAALVTSLGSAWSLRLGNLWERDIDPSPGVKKDDLRTTLSLQYSF